MASARVTLRSADSEISEQILHLSYDPLDELMSCWWYVIHRELASDIDLPGAPLHIHRDEGSWAPSLWGRADALTCVERSDGRRA
jgi:hypothetical protein